MKARKVYVTVLQFTLYSICLKSPKSICYLSFNKIGVKLPKYRNVFMKLKNKTLSLLWDSNRQSLGIEVTESFKHMRNRMRQKNCRKRL